MGIYHKDCPRCATTVATYISRCECGFSFDGNEEADPAARLEALIEEERLYEEYLAARAKQAMAASGAATRSVTSWAPACWYVSSENPLPSPAPACTRTRWPCETSADRRNPGGDRGRQDRFPQGART